MGCGTSKAAQVVEGDITIKDYPSSHHHDTDPPVGVVPSSSSATAAGDEPGIRHEPSNQSVLEREVHNIVSPSGSSPQQPIMESTSQERMHDQALPSESTESLPKPVAFEVCISPDGESNPKGRLPKRLSKIESVPKNLVTSEILAEKQKAADDRKLKELEKRANPRLSKKDRLRKEILEAREMEISQEQYIEIETTLSAGSLNRAKSQAEVVEKQKLREEHAKKVRDKAQQLSNNEEQNGTISYDASVEIEVDSTYNADQQIEFWESQSSQNEEEKRSEPKEQNGSDDLLHNDNHGEDVQHNNNSSDKLEQYM